MKIILILAIIGGLVFNWLAIREVEYRRRHK